MARMSKKKHRDRSWAPTPEPLPANAQVIDNHTHVASVVPFSRAMSHEAVEKGQPEVPVYSVDELLAGLGSRGYRSDRLRVLTAEPHDRRRHGTRARTRVRGARHPPQ